MCPVNYSRSKLSGNEVPGFKPRAFSSSFLLEPLLLPLPPSLDEERQAGSHLRRNKPPKERERTNKSARAVRRDIVSCKVNHLRGSKTASSPRKNPFAASPPPSSLLFPAIYSRPRGDVCYLYLCAAHRGCTANPSPPLPPFIFLLFFFFFFRIFFLLSFFAVSPVSVNMRTHGLVISVIGSLTPARPSPRRGSEEVARFFHGMADFLVSLLGLEDIFFERNRLVIGFN